MRSAGTRTSRPRIAIVGANFAGLSAAQHLGREFAVTVIDHSPSFEWLPNIHELLSGVKRPAELRLPRPRLVARAGHRFVRATVTAIDARAGRLITSAGRKFDFDVCIVAVGGVNETFGVKGVDRHAMPFKSVDACAAIGRKLAALAHRPGKHSIVIVGGGLEGVEALGEILRRYRHLENVSISVIEAGPRLLPGTPPALDAAVRARCSDYNVRILTRAPVTGITGSRVRLRSGEVLRSDLTIWTGGVTAPALLSESGLADRPRQWAPVTSGLRSKRFDNVFVVGDSAGLPRPLGKQAYYAMQMGECAADNARRALAGRALRPFKPSPKPMLVAFGDLDTYLVSGRRVIASPGLAAIKEAVFQLTMAEFDPPLNAPALQQLAARLTGAAKRLAPPILGSAGARARVR
jgi:NADH dehydrogenase FAD-containing subunit